MRCVVIMKEHQIEQHGVKTRECPLCLYFDPREDGRENCLRFARFVDHLLAEKTRDCEYWEQIHR